jgi:hypothetical protein
MGVDITEGQSIDHIIVTLKVCRTDYTFERYHAIKGNNIRIAGAEDEYSECYSTCLTKASCARCVGFD